MSRKRRVFSAEFKTKVVLELLSGELTVAQVAQVAGIGKGTIYEYFENKDDIVFEIMNIHIEENQKQFLEVIQTIKSTKEKIFLKVYHIRPFRKRAACYF